MKTIRNLTAEEIRKSILQLAIQGKLVKQDPSDEPASELVKRIYAEKQKLIKEGKIKKDKNESYIYKGDDNCYYEKVGKNKVIKLENLPFEIPENWSWIRLSSFCDIYTGDSINENDKNKLYRNRSEGYDYIGTKDVNFNHTIVYENGVKIPYDTQFKICPKSKILLCIEGGSAGRKIAFTSKDVCFGNKLACFNSWIIDDRYLYLFLQSPLFLQLFKDKLTGIISGVSINNLKQLFLPLPPLEEQERIVEKFKSCEPLLSRYELIEQNITLLETSLEEKLKASILQYAIEGKLVKQNPNDEPASVLLERIKAEKEKLISEGKIKRDKNESTIYLCDDKNYYRKFYKSSLVKALEIDLYSIPYSWSWCTLGEISKQISDGTHRTPKYVNDGVPFLSISNISTGKYDGRPKYITELEHKELIRRCKPEKDDILICRIGTLGKPYIIDFNFEFSIFVSLGLIKLMDKSLVNYVQRVLSSPLSLKFIDKIKVGGGTHTYKINVENLYGFPIPIPPFNELNRIMLKLDQIFFQF